MILVWGFIGCDQQFEKHIMVSLPLRLLISYVVKEFYLFFYGLSLFALALEDFSYFLNFLILSSFYTYVINVSGIFLHIMR